MTTMRIGSGTIISLALLLGACGGGKGKQGPEEISGDSGTINGLVTDVGNGARLSGVSVTGGGKSTTTDAKGEFTLTGLSSGTVTLTFTKEGYALGYATPRARDSAAPAVIALKKAGRFQTYNASSQTTLSERTEAGPYALILSPNSLDTTATSLRISVTPLDPTKEQSSLPGELTSGGSSPTLLIPVTFAEFTILDPSGNRVGLRATRTATVELPIPPTLRSQYPLNTTIHCYAFNPATGQWEDFVEGNVVVSSVDNISPVLKASIRHFSWYGGAPQGRDCVDVYGRVVSAVDGRPLPNARVEAFPGTVGYSDANGDFKVLTVAGRGSDFTAYRTYYLSQETVVGGVRLPRGAKVIEFGKVTENLPGLVRRPCSGGSALTEATVDEMVGARGERSDPIVVKIGFISRFSYEALGVLDATQGAGSNALMTLERGIPGPNGRLEEPKEHVSGAKIWLTAPGGQNINLTEASAGTGLYIATGATIVDGQPYTISIDPEGTGTVKGSGSISAIGRIAWVRPTSGQTLPASNLRVEWSDTGATRGNPNYAPYYLVSLTKTASPSDSAIYQGTDRQFNARSAITGQTLRAGRYTGSIWAISGPFAPSGGGFATPTNNITGPDISGQFYSVGSLLQPIDFTLQ